MSDKKEPEENTDWIDEFLKSVESIYDDKDIKPAEGSKWGVKK